MEKNIYFKCYKKETLYLLRCKRLDKKAGGKFYIIIYKGDTKGCCTHIGKKWVVTLTDLCECHINLNLWDVEKLLADKILKAYSDIPRETTN